MNQENLDQERVRQGFNRLDLVRTERTIDLKQKELQHAKDNVKIEQLTLLSNTNLREPSIKVHYHIEVLDDLLRHHVKKSLAMLGHPLVSLGLIIVSFLIIYNYLNSTVGVDKFSDNEWLSTGLIFLAAVITDLASIFFTYGCLMALEHWFRSHPLRFLNTLTAMILTFGLLGFISFCLLIYDRISTT